MSEVTQSTKYYTEITGEHNLFDLKLKEVWDYRELIGMFTKRNFTTAYKQTVLGPAWLFINPVMSSLIYCFIFGGIAHLSTDGIPQMLFYLSGNAIWSYFASCLTSNASTFTANAGIYGKVYFPRLTTPISNVLSAIIRFGIQMIMTVIFLIYYVAVGKVSPNWHLWILIPVILVHLGLMGMGCGIIISSMTTKYRDLTVLVGFAMSLWMYITPIIYPISQVGHTWMGKILMINPVTAPVELFRYAFLGQGMVSAGYLAWSWIFTAIVVVLGIMVFNKVERTFMDTV